MFIARLEGSAAVWPEGMAQMTTWLEIKVSAKYSADTNGIYITLTTGSKNNARRFQSPCRMWGQHHLHDQQHPKNIATICSSPLNYFEQLEMRSNRSFNLEPNPNPLKKTPKILLSLKITNQANPHGMLVSRWCLTFFSMCFLQFPSLAVCIIISMFQAFLSW